MTDSIKCPSCGAQSSNFANCDYCNGFIGTSNEEVSNLEDFVFDGLIKAFANNLKLQENGGGLVITTIDIGNTSIGVGQSNRISTETNPSFPGLTIQLFESEFVGDRWSKVLKLDEAIMTNNFNPKNKDDVEYLIDFGQDIDAAAIVASKIFLINEARSAKIRIITEDLDGKVSTKYVYGDKEDNQSPKQEAGSVVKKKLGMFDVGGSMDVWIQGGSIGAGIFGIIVLGGTIYVVYKIIRLILNSLGILELT